MDALGRAYGAGMATGRFDPIAFIKKPTVILRIVSWLFAVIVFGCISGGGWYKIKNVDVCAYNKDSGACGFGTAIGVLAFLACTAFLALDAYFDNISSVQLRRQVVIADLAVSGVGVFMYFVSFCYLTNKWSNTSIADFKKDNVVLNVGNIQAAIAFSFFSVFTWAAMTFFAWRRYQEGAASAFAPSYESDIPPSNTMPGYGYAGSGEFGGAQSYQEPPFTASNENAGGGYQKPTY